MSETTAERATAGRAQHEYRLALSWEGNTGEGTASYAGYGRSFRVRLPGKADLLGSADPVFRGDGALPNPEELLLAAVASCHMLVYLALCARRGISVTSYLDPADGVMETSPGGGGRFRKITLRPQVTLALGSDLEHARALHADAGKLCFIARSCNFPILYEPRVVAAVTASPPGDRPLEEESR